MSTDSAAGIATKVAAAGLFGLLAHKYLSARTVRTVPAVQCTWAKEISIPEQKKFAGLSFPLCLAPANEALGANDAASAVHAHVREDMAWIKEQLLQYGAILFRGFPTRDAASFDAFVCAFLSAYVSISQCACAHICARSKMDAMCGLTRVYVHS